MQPDSMPFYRRKLFITAAALPVLLIVIFLLTYKIVESRVQTLPANSPAVCSWSEEERPSRVVVNAGDSLTHGTVSANYVDRLQQRFKDAFFVNAGINSQLAYNLLQRVDEIARCKPDIVTILIGTNDVNASLNEQKKVEYIKEQQLPQEPDLAFFTASLRSLVKELRQKTTGRIILLSLPLIGEDPNSAANRQAARYSTEIHKIADEQKTGYIRLNEKMNIFMKRRPAVIGKCEDGRYYIEEAVARYYLLGQSYNEIAAANGFTLTTDCLHASDTTAGLISSEIAQLLKQAGLKETLP